MKLVFVRHGNDKKGKLTLLGKKQAKMVCHELVYEYIKKIYVSPMERTFKTAKIIQNKLGIKDIIIDGRLSEREPISLNLSRSIFDELNDNYLNPSHSNKSPEGCKEYVERIFSFLDEIKNTNKDIAVLVVGHSSMLYVILAYIYGYNKGNQLNWARLGNCSKICFELN